PSGDSWTSSAAVARCRSVRSAKPCPISACVSRVAWRPSMGLEFYVARWKAQPPKRPNWGPGSQSCSWRWALPISSIGSRNPHRPRYHHPEYFAMSPTRALEGLRILVTRPKHQADQLTSRLKNLGGEVVELPMIAIAPPESWEPLDNALKQLERYQ